MKGRLHLVNWPKGTEQGKKGRSRGRKVKKDLQGIKKSQFYGHD